MSFIRRVIRSLKHRRAWSKPVDIYRTISRSTNLSTGVDTIVRQKLHIKRAIVSPPQTQFQAPQSNPSGSMKFGGFLEMQTTSVILDGRDVGDFEINIEDCQVVIAKQRYEIYRVQPYNKEAYVLTLKAIQGALVEAIQDSERADNLIFIENYTGSLL